MPSYFPQGFPEPRDEISKRTIPPFFFFGVSLLDDDGHFSGKMKLKRIIKIERRNLCLKAQHYEVLPIEWLYWNNVISMCTNDEILGVIIYGESDCDNITWNVTEYHGPSIIENGIADSIVIPNPNEGKTYLISYNGCNYNKKQSNLADYTRTS